MELYIHIPFCKRKCEYCSFVSFAADSAQKDEYIEILLKEARIRQSEFTDKIDTVFIGGGTPSLLSPAQLERTVTGIRKYLRSDSCTEFTIEANPGTLTEEFVGTAVRLGINRFSIGMQACQDAILKRLGRIHSYSDVRSSVSIMRKHHIENFNLDLIFGIPGQTLSDWEKTLDAAISLHPAHISAYGLIPEEGTPLFERLTIGEIELPSQEEERKMYDLALKRLAESGYRQYEISNFALEGYECRHNIGYWTQVPYVGLGVSAASMRITGMTEKGMQCIRKKNPDSLADYYRMILEQDETCAETETVNPEEARFETMMLALRMNSGISERRFYEMHGMRIEDCYGTKLAEMQQKGLMKHENGSWSLTRKGMDIQNTVLVEFMDNQ